MTNTENEHNNRGKIQWEPVKRFHEQSSRQHSLYLTFTFAAYLPLPVPPSTTSTSVHATFHLRYFLVPLSGLSLSPFRVRRVKTGVSFSHIMDSSQNLKIDLHSAVTFKQMWRTVMPGRTSLNLYFKNIQKKEREKHLRIINSKLRANHV